MEATDLMIGDWVLYENDYGKVWCLDEASDLVGLDLSDNMSTQDAHFEDIFPIPLTPEILEKNGFDCKHKGEALKRLYWILNVGGGSVKVKINRGLFLFDIFGVPFQHGFYRPFVNKHIQYVHELQHALRLCGIDKEIEL